MAQVLGELIWGTNISAFYQDVARLADLPAGIAVVAYFSARKPT